MSTRTRKKPLPKKPKGSKHPMKMKKPMKKAKKNPQHG